MMINSEINYVVLILTFSHKRIDKFCFSELVRICDTGYKIRTIRFLKEAGNYLPN